MDPFDPVRNEEGGHSKRRTSILKVPRKSILATEDVQQNNVVECAKPSDKRISRRVSFAPANDVHLFAKDVKNTSPTRSPLQELMSDGATQNGVQIKVPEDQQFTGMDIFQNTPKQVFQQKNEAFVSGSNFGEKTIMFNADDLDMTQCHTIKIAKDKELLSTSHGFLHGHGEKTMIFDRSMDMTLSQTLNMTCDQDMSFSSKPTPPSVFPFTSAMTHGTEFISYAHIDKENLIPKSLTKKMGDPNFDSGGSEDGFSMTEANPLQCLFPQDISTEPDRRKSQTCSKDNDFTYEPIENASKRVVLFDPKNNGRSEKTIVFSDGGFMDITQNWTSNIMVAPSVSSTQDKCLKERKSITPTLSARLLEEQEWVQHQDFKLQRGSSYKGLGTSFKTSMHQVMTDSEEESKEKTVRFSIDDACMDVTSCHTVKISSDLQLQPDLGRLPVSGEKTVRFTTNEAGMDITQCLTVNIARDLVPDIPVLQKEESSFKSLPVQSVDLEFENFFASLSGQKPQVNTSQDDTSKPLIKTQSKTQTMLLKNDSKITKGPNEEAENCLDESNVNMNISEAHIRLKANVGQAGVTSQQRRSVLLTDPNNGFKSARKSQIQRRLVNFDAEDLRSERTVQFAADDALMDVTSSHTVHISTDQKPDLPFSEKTVQFDTAMDTTQCHTVHITNDLDPPLHEGLGLLPKYGEKKYSADNATMDVTSSHTVHISTALKPDLPFSEKTAQFDTAMDTTQCLTLSVINEFTPPVSINNETKSCMGLKENNLQKCATDSKLQLHGNIFPLSGEKTIRFNIDDANMDVTKSNTMMIDIEPQVIPDLAVLPRSEDRTMQFSSDDGGMEVTQCLTSNIGFEMEASRADLSPISTSITMDCPPPLKKREPVIYTNRRCRSLAGHGLNSALKARRSVPWGSQGVTSTSVTVNDDVNATQSQLLSKGDFKCDTGSFETSKTGANEKAGFLSVIEEKSIAEISQKEECQENRDIKMTEAQSVQMHRQTISEDCNQGSALTASTPSVEQDNHKEIVSECEVEINVQPDPPQINNKKDDERAVKEPTECLPAFVEKDSEVVQSQKSRRRSLADIQSKMRRISQMLTEPPDNVAVDGSTLMPSLDPEPKVEVHEIRSVPKDEPDANVNTGQGENKLDDAQEEPLGAHTTPFKLETKRLMSRLSVVGVKPKLPRRSKREEAKTPDSSLALAVADTTKTLNIQIQNKVGDFDLNVSDINDEELENYEDMSETLDTNSMDKELDRITSFHEFELDQELQDDVFEEEFALTNERKRPLPDELNITDEKRMKTCNETIILDSQTCTLEGDNVAAASAQTADSSNCSQTASLRCEATFESTSKQSLFESQLEDYASDIQRKFDDGTLTMTEFFKLFHIDFVIHTPRQSVVPGRALSDPESTLLDLSHDRHISLPKQLVYEANVRNLTEQVEGFKVRMRDLDKPLTQVNRTLWEEMEHFSEAEFKSFGARLKERHSLYRKMSKAQSHEMKGLLYSDLIQANVEEQQKLKGSIEKADAMLKNLDGSIAELEADLLTVEDDIKSHQEELNKVTDALATNEKSTGELEIQKKQNVNKIRRVKDETMNLERHLNMLHTLNEWKLVEIRTSAAIYTFLHKTLHLVLVYEDEESKGNEDERKIADISFEHLLDERSQCHAHLVHTLVSQFTQDKSLTRKYSTSKHVPQLLHDISLVVSRCRQLGEELRRLKTWGSMRYDILDIHCLHSEVYIVFSSLKRFAKFEIVFNVTLTNQLCALELTSFKNIIGNTTIEHIEEIVASSAPGQNFLTKTIKSIHSSLLC